MRRAAAINKFILLASCFALTACAHMAFLAANIPASFAHFTRVSNVSYGSGKRQTLDVYMPKGKPGGPVIVFVYGGGWNSGDKDEYKFVGATLAEQGWIAVVPNYRLYPEVKYPTFVEDAAAALVWAHAHATDYGGDASEIFLMGHSAGAHIAMMVALDPLYLDSKPTWLKGVVGLAGPYDFLPFTRDYMRDVFGPEVRYSASQPINFIRPDAPPLLLLHGADDTTVLPKNSINLAAAMAQSGGHVELKLYGHVNHTAILAALSIPGRNRAPVLDDMNRFIGQQTKGAPPATPPSGH